ncbi:MAG: LysR family transcriptional regulator [Bdellovibrionales bacterium]|nr:LysR family transcriptional regulator [Bdellovibrionales bacterium]
MYIKDHLEKLNYFFHVARAGSIKEASTQLNITQPSVTKSIQILEDAVGSPLFVRQPRGVMVTQEGQILLEFCHQLFSQLENLEMRLAAPEDPLAGHLKVGTYDSIAIYFWPKFLKTFLAENVNLDIELTTDRSHTIQKMVEEGELDIGLIIEPTEHKHLEVIELGVDSFQLYCSSKLKKDMGDGTQYPIIYMPDALAGGGEKRLIHQMKFSTVKERIKEYRTSSLESAKELITNGIGVGLLPKMVARDSILKKQIVRFQPEWFPKRGVGKHRIGLIFPKRLAASKVMSQLIESIRQSDSW